MPRKITKKTEGKVETLEMVEGEQVKEEKVEIVEEPEISGVEKRGEIPKETITDEQLTKQVKAEVFKTEPKEEPIKVEEKLQKGMVRVRVLVGTLKFDDQTYEKGNIFTVSKKRTEGFDPRFFEIIS